jgi:hypothetical protein
VTALHYRRFGAVRGGAAGVDLNYGGADELQLTAELPVACQPGPSTRIGVETLEIAA